MTAATHGQRLDISAVPGLRVLASRAFRTVLAATLSLIGVSMLVLYPGLLSAVGFEGGHDFFAFLTGSERWLEGGSPYAAEQLSGGAAAVCLECYLYPPLLAQLLSPLTLVPRAGAELAWYGLQFGAMYAAMWLATGIGGAARSLERALWCLASMLLFVPVFSSFWYGNISTLVALGATLVALGGTAAGVSAAALALVKVSPATFVPIALVMGRESRRAVVASLAVLLAVSFALAPGAWLEYPRILLDLAAYAPGSVAPADIAARLGSPEVVAGAVRALTLAGGGLALLTGLWLARQRAAWPLAAYLGAIAMLLIPGTLWYHYLAVLLPFAAMAWSRAGAITRLGLLLSAGAVSASFGVDALALAGATAMFLFTVTALWPRGETVEAQGDGGRLASTGSPSTA